MEEEQAQWRREEMAETQKHNSSKAMTVGNARTQFGMTKVGLMLERVGIVNIAEQFITLPIIFHPTNMHSQDTDINRHATEHRTALAQNCQQQWVYARGQRMEKPVTPL
jgi:hypothetical protein